MIKSWGILRFTCPESALLKFVFWVGMVKWLAKRWLVCLLGSSIVLLLEMMFPSPVQAECGDYVTMKNESTQHNSTDIEIFPSPPVQTPCSRTKPNQDGSFPGDLPCHGPGCSKQNAPPLLPMKVAPQRHQPDQAFVLVEVVNYPDSSRSGFLDQNDSNHFSPILSRLYRPPRAS